MPSKPNVRFFFVDAMTQAESRNPLAILRNSLFPRDCSLLKFSVIPMMNQFPCLIFIPTGSLPRQSLPSGTQGFKVGCKNEEFR